MLAQFVDVCCACLPADGLASLAEVRAVPGVMVLQERTRTWVRWEAGDERVLERVLPIPGAILYSFREGRWFRLGEHLPAFEVVTEGDFQPLHQVLFPAPVQPLSSRTERWPQILLSLQPDSRPRPTSAMICPVPDMLAWMDGVPSSRLTALQGARNDRELIVLGPRLPLLPAGQRLWGETILKPLGYCIVPDLPESTLRESLNLDVDEILIMIEGRTEILCRSLLRPLNRASLRKMVPKVAP